MQILPRPPKSSAAGGMTRGVVPPERPYCPRRPRARLGSLRSTQYGSRRRPLARHRRARPPREGLRSSVRDVQEIGPQRRVRALRRAFRPEMGCMYPRGRKVALRADMRRKRPEMQHFWEMCCSFTISDNSAFSATFWAFVLRAISGLLQPLRGCQRRREAASSPPPNFETQNSQIPGRAPREARASESAGVDPDGGSQRVCLMLQIADLPRCATPLHRRKGLDLPLRGTGCPRR